MSKEQELPFKGLGYRLKVIRQKLHETLSEVSGAVEIDEKDLERIEQGQDRPSEDILMLLINHFGMREDEAAGLWQLAGYEQPPVEERDDHDSNNGRMTMVVMALDPRVIYSDSVQVVANKNGVVVNFAQGSGPAQPLTVSRIGMSRDQAENLVHYLSTALENSKPRQLPPADQI